MHRLVTMRLPVNAMALGLILDFSAKERCVNPLYLDTLRNVLITDCLSEILDP